MKRFQVFTFSALSLVVAACSGGGNAPVAGNQCPRVYDPIPMNVPAKDVKNKIEWEKLTDIPIGDYQQLEANLYYVDDQYAPDHNFRIRVTDVKQKDGSWKPDVTKGCVRNARRDLADLTVATEGVSHLVIDNTKSVKVTDTREFGFKIDSLGKLDYNFNAPVQKPGTDPGSIYQGKVQQSFIYKRNDTDYELRSQGVIPGKGTYWLSVVLRRQPVPACPAVTPIAINIPDTDAKKIEWAKLGEKLPAGRYEEVSTKLYFEEKETAARAFRIQVLDEKLSDKVNKSVTSCVTNNARTDLKPLAMVTNSITGVTVGADKSIVIDTQPRHLTVAPEPKPAPSGQLKVGFEKVGSSDEVEGKITAGVAYKINETDYELRSVGTVQTPGQSGTYYLSTIVRRKP